MQRGKLLMISALSFLLTVPLTGCQLPELPVSEKVSLQIVIDELGSQVIEREEESMPPGLAKTDGIPPGLAKGNGLPPGQAKKAHKKGDSVMMVGGLIHPKNAKHPQLIGTSGEYYELVSNQTSYDIFSIRTKVPFLQVRLVITGRKGDSTYYAELVEVVDQGFWVYGELEKEKNRFVFKQKEKGKGKSRGKGKNKNKGGEYKYIIVENHSGQKLDRYKKRDNFYFVRIISLHGDIAQIRLLDIR